MAVPSVAVVTLASCDGCQLTLLNCEDELLALAGAVRFSYFPLVQSEAGANAGQEDGAAPGGPIGEGAAGEGAVGEGAVGEGAVGEGAAGEGEVWDVCLVEGSVTTPADAERIQRVRRRSRCLVTLGACATSGGIQALRNLADVGEYRRLVYARPELVATLERSTPIAAHVTVDVQLHGCPIDRHQVLEVLAALLQDRRPRLPSYSVCVECKRSGTVCVAVARGAPCLGPVTRAGCGALCPRHGRGCFGCFGPQDAANTAALTDHLVALGTPARDVQRLFRTFAVGAEAFRQESARHGPPPPAHGEGSG